MATANPIQTEEKTYCAVHPDRETGLRCNKCGRLMCVDCAVLTPVGYRCRECVRGIQDKFFTASPNDYAIIFGVSLLTAGVLGAIASAINLPLLFAIILGLPIGGAVAEVSLRAIRRRRGRRSAEVAAAGVVVGGLLGAIAQTYLALEPLASRANVDTGQLLDVVFRRSVGDLGLLLFVILMAVAVFGRYRMRS